MKKCGISICSTPFSDEWISGLKSGGIDCFELSAYKICDYSGISEICQKHGVEAWSAHLPFGYDIDISSLEGTVAEDTVKLDIEIMRLVAKEGFKVCVIHPSSEPIADSDRKARMEMAKANLKILAKEADSLGMTLAVEDLPRTCLGRNSDEILELIGADDRLRVCFDTNHLLGEPIEEFILRVGKYIVTTHVSDYDFVDERHLLPGEGDIDWNMVADELEKAGYEGPFLYELEFGSSTKIERPQNLTPADFKENYDCIMQRIAPPLHEGKLLFK